MDTLRALFVLCLGVSLLKSATSKFSFWRQVNHNTSWIEDDLFNVKVLTFKMDFKISFASEDCCPIFAVSSFSLRRYLNVGCFRDDITELSSWYRGVFLLNPSAKMDERNRLICTDEQGVIICSVHYEALYYKSTQVTYRIGYTCSEVESAGNFTNLFYNFSFTNVSNQTECEPIKRDHLPPSLPCNKYFTWIALPNLLGFKSQRDTRLLYMFATSITNLFKDSGPCHKFAEAMTCIYFFSGCVTWDLDRSRFPTADNHKPQNTSVTRTSLFVVCREMCEELVTSCSAPKFQNIIRLLDCTYFPLYNESDTCVWETVTCSEPLPPYEGSSVLISDWDNYTTGSTVKYQCDGGQHKGGTLTCEPSGRWSSPNDSCRAEKGTGTSTPRTEKWIIALPSSVGIFILIRVLLLILCIQKRMQKSKKAKETEKTYPKRNGPYDAWVSYSNQDFDFACDTLKRKLETEMHPPFKLCVHDQDFRPGKLISDNISEAIKQSNCAIVLFSETYANAPWCQQEFQAIIEETRDGAYKVFVIMMTRDIPGTLENLPEFMQQHCRSETYLFKDDPGLWEKLAKELSELQGCTNQTEETILWLLTLLTTCL